MYFVYSQRMRDITTSPSCGGTACPGLLEERNCSVNQTINCELSPWGAWSNCSTDCGTGVQFRDRSLLTPAYCGGNQCANMDLEEQRECESFAAKQDCKVNKQIELEFGINKERFWSLKIGF